MTDEIVLVGGLDAPEPEHGRWHEGKHGGGKNRETLAVGCPQKEDEGGNSNWNDGVKLGEESKTANNASGNGEIAVASCGTGGVSEGEEEEGGSERVDESVVVDSGGGEEEAG